MQMSLINWRGKELSAKVLQYLLKETFLSGVRNSDNWWCARVGWLEVINKGSLYHRHRHHHRHHRHSPLHVLQPPSPATIVSPASKNYEASQKKSVSNINSEGSTKLMNKLSFSAVKRSCSAIDRPPFPWNDMSSVLVLHDAYFYLQLQSETEALNLVFKNYPNIWRIGRGRVWLHLYPQNILEYF